MKRAAFLFAIFLLLNVIIFTALGCHLSEPSGLSVKIDGSHALAIAAKDKKVKLFIKSNFKKPETRIDEVNLKYFAKTKKYSWIVQFSERACACRGINKLNVAKVTIDPNNGRVIEYEFNKSIKENDLLKKTCMKGCHR